MFKKIISMILAIVLIGNQVVLGLNVSAKSAVIIDSDTLEVLYGKNENTEQAMASTTKIMTALIVLENTTLEREIEIKKEYASIEGSSMYLQTGEIVTIEELLYGLMLMSGNDSAVALASETTGDYDEFIGLMNEKAKDLGLENTSFANANGLDAENHYTTAYELAILSANALKNEKFAEIVSSKYYTSETRVMKNHNKLLWNDDEYLGVKTGFTSNAGRCLVTAYNVNGKTLIAVTMDCSNDWQEHENMYNEFKNIYEKYNLYTKDEIYDIIKIMSGNKSETAVVLADNVNLLLTSEQKKKVEIEVLAPKIVYAPIKSGEIYGEVVFKVDEIEIFRTNLIFIENITLEYVETMNLFEKFIEFIKNLFY